MKYSDTKEVYEKIDELFAFRKLADLHTLYPVSEDFYAQLRDLQYQIYLLDDYLESNWKLDPLEAKIHWDKMNTALYGLLKNEKQVYKWFKEIRKYEKYEMQCRTQKWPTGVSFIEFYTTKSCDVRLDRRLIYHFSPQLEQVWKEKSWLFFDQITEVHDDVEDIREDLPTYNANRFLVALLRNGIPDTLKEYRKGLRKIEKKAFAYFARFDANDPHMQVFEITLRQLDATKMMLKNFSGTFDLSLLSGSKMLENMK